MKYTVLISLLFWVFDGIKAQSVREVDICIYMVVHPRVSLRHIRLRIWGRVSFLSNLAVIWVG